MQAQNARFAFICQRTYRFDIMWAGSRRYNVGRPFFWLQLKPTYCRFSLWNGNVFDSEQMYSISSEQVRSRRYAVVCK